MLTTLRIKNLALVSDLTLELQPGCNVITGETGAGKSIIIGALNLVLGERADRTLIRSGEESCSVEAVFDVAKLKRAAENFSGGERPGAVRGKSARPQTHVHQPPARTASSSTARPPR
jgi:DNA repair ATPase RecN